MKMRTHFLKVFLILLTSVSAYAQYPGDLQDLDNNLPKIEVSKEISVKFSADELKAEPKFKKIIAILQQRWPVFEKRALVFIQQAQKIISDSLIESQDKFARNLSIILRNTLFIEGLQVEGNSLVSNEQAIVAAGFSSGRWIWELDLDSSEGGLKHLAWVKKASTKATIFPVGMKVTLEEYSPWMLAELGRRLWIVAENGTLLSPVAEVKNLETLRSLRSLPRLVGLGDNERWEAETYLRSENARYHHAVASIKFIQQAGELPFRVGLIQLMPDGSLEISAAERSKQFPIVVLQVTNAEEAKNTIEVLKKVLADLESKNELAKKIDLRFENRVIVS